MAQLPTKTTGDVAEVIAHDVEPLTVHTDATGYSRLGWIVLLVGVAGFLLWAILAPLDKGVPLQGVVAKESNRKTIQHQLGGTVAEILVRDGDTVKTGQVLVRMNDVNTRAQVEMTSAQYFTARLTEARLLAERDGAATLSLPAELADHKDDPRVSGNLALQQQLMSSRQAALRNELGAMEENIAGLRMQAKGLEESRDSKKVQLGILKEQLDNMRDLAKDGYIARSRLLDVERTYAQVNGSISEDIGNIGRAQRQIMELNLRRAQRTQEYQKEVRTQLSDVQREADSQHSRLLAQRFELDNVNVRSPVDGVVVGSTVFTQGGVVAPGFHLMDIVPADDALVVEGQLPVNLVDKVHVGLPAELMFSAFNANRTPHIPGTVIQVAADRSIDEHSGQPYYKVRARVTPEGAKMIASHKLPIQSGMPVELFVKTGERTMMNYLLKPVLDRAKSSMTEE
jgi:protease secretion system membrane fusion protein